MQAFKGDPEMKALAIMAVEKRANIFLFSDSKGNGCAIGSPLIELGMEPALMGSGVEQSPVSEKFAETFGVPLAVANLIEGAYMHADRASREENRDSFTNGRAVVIELLESIPVGADLSDWTLGKGEPRTEAMAHMSRTRIAESIEAFKSQVRELTPA